MRRKYSVIVFDLGNVLVPFDYKILINNLNAVKDGLGKRFMDFYMNNYSYHRSFERGELEAEKFIEVMLKTCENSIDEETFCRYFAGVFREDEKVTSLLPELKKKYRLFLLSNTNSIHRIYGYQHYEFLNNFDKLFLSYEVGALKPEPEIYKAVENYTGIPAHEHLFIDDVAEYAEGARRMGWDVIQFFDYYQLVDQLKKREIL